MTSSAVYSHLRWADINLNEEQLQVITHKAGPLLIIAGPGTGKTSVITERIKYLILNNLAKTSEILALTFTEKAAREMEERVDIAMPYGYTQMWISTFHAFCDRILRQEALAIGCPPNYKMFAETESTQLIRDQLFSFDLDYFRPLGNPTKFVGGFLRHFSRLQDENVTPFSYIKWANSKFKRQNSKLDKEEVGKYLELAKAYQKYTELKIKEGVMDFGDLITNTLSLFKKRPALLKRYQEQFKYILVDEFQDTNIAQYELLKILAPPRKNSNLTVVGDDSQSIYKFRGAAVSNILQFMRDYKRAKQVVLIKNYRSTQAILDSAHRLIKFNDPDTLEVKLGISKALQKTRDATELEIELIYADRVENEADQVARKILQLVEKDRQYSDFAILVRANNHSEPFVRALSRLGIPYQFLGPGQLFRQEEVKDLIAYLKILDNITDSISCYRVLTMDCFGISARDIALLAAFARRKNISLFESCEQSEDKKIKQFVSMVNRHLGLMRKESAGQILYYFLEDTQLLQKLLNTQNAKSEREAQNVSKFFDKLKTYETDHQDASVQAVVNWIDLSMELGESPQASNIDWDHLNAVNILTVHSSKGLEFPVVFLVNLVTGRFPPYERREQIPIPEDLIKETLPQGDYHLEEERRLFYVGMTRARDRLYFTAANYYGEGKRERKLSPFVIEALGEEITKRQSNPLTKLPNNQLTFLDWAKVDEPNQTSVDTQVSITRLSYSQINDFKVCPLHYKLKYIVGIPSPVSSAQSFGITIHKTLADFYSRHKGGLEATLDNLLKLYSQSWINEGYASKHHEDLMKNRGREYLKTFYNNEFKFNQIPLNLEHNFSFKVKNLQIRGKIDRIDQTKEGIEIIDYKTGVKIPTDKEIAKDLQLTLYAMAANEVKEPPFGRPPEQIALSLYYFDQGRRLTTKRTIGELVKAREELIKIANEIITSDFACSGSILCTDCEYKIFCQTPARDRGK